MKFKRLLLLSLVLMYCPIVLLGQFEVFASAEPNLVCLGEAVQLDVEVVGGLGSYAYIWSSIPPGFNTTLKSPIIIPQEHTAYIIWASDGDNSGYDTVYVEVYPYPELSLGADTIICPVDEIILDAGPGHHSYLWQDGSTTQTFLASEAGIYWVMVDNDHGCISADSLVLSVYEEPEKPALPAGPSFINLEEMQSSGYVTSAAPNVIEYAWELTPTQAGSLENNGDQAIIHWDTTFTGIAMLQVRASNICGSGEWSEGLNINVVNTTDINELENLISVEVYPNPSRGYFVLSYQSDQQLDLKMFITDQLAKVIFQKDISIIKGQSNEVLELRDQPPGIYLLTLSSTRGIINRKLIITE